MNTNTTLSKGSWIQFKSLLASLVLALVIDQSHGAPGEVDLSFDPGSGVNGQIVAIAVQSDGKILIGGTFTTVHGAMRSGIARLNTDGSVDETFLHGMTGVINLGGDLWVNAVAVQSDGKVLIGGEFTTVNGTARTHLARLNADGSLDAAFLSGMAGPDWGVGSVVLQSDGKILIVGSFSSINGVTMNGFARLNADGSVDTSFHFGGGTDDVTLQNDGKMLIWRGNELTRLKIDGSIDSSFAVSIGTSEPTYSIRSVAVQSDGKILVGGWFSSVNGVARNCFARLNPNGSLDSTFLQGLAGMDSEVLATAEQSDGKILIGGWFNTVNGTPQPFLARLNADGSLDTSFLNGLAGLEGGNRAVLAFQVQDDAKILIRGFFCAVNSVGRPGFARLNSDGSTDVSFMSARSGPNGSVIAVACQTDGKILLAGGFNFVDDEPRTNLARLNVDGSLDNTFGVSITGGSDSPLHCLGVQSDGKILVGGGFGAVNGVACNGIARLAADGSLDGSFAASIGGDYYSYNSQVGQVRAQSDGKILVGGTFTLINGIGRTNLARLNADGSLDGSFNTPITTSDYVFPVVVQADGRILVGGYSVPGGGALQKGIIRLRSDGAVDNSFLNGLAGISGEVYAVAQQSDGKILVGGVFSSVNGVPRHALTRLNPDGSLDTAFLDSLAGKAYGIGRLALQNNGKVLVSPWFGSLSDGMYPTNIARVNADGSLDYAFLSGLPGPNAPASSLIPQADGKILIAGGFTSVNGTPRRYVARLIGDYAAPILISGPSSTTAEIGSTAFFSVRATGSPVLTCAWFFNGNVPVGPVMTNCTLNLSNVQPSQAGVYTVVITNAAGAVTSAPAMLNVVAAVERRPVPGVEVTGEAGSLWNVDYADSLNPAPTWTTLGSVSLTSTPQYCFDLTLPLPPQRFYRAWQTGTPGVRPSLDLHPVPAITLTGTIGHSVRLDYINQFGPIDAWATLATVPLTNTSQLYFDTSAPGQPPRLYRLVPSP